MDYFITFWKFIFIFHHIGVWCSPLSQDDKSYLVNYLNAKRREVGASDMYAMQWDDSLGSDAQSQVGSGACTRGTQKENYQMLFQYRSKSIATLKEFMEGWYNGTEIDDYAKNCTGCSYYKHWVNAQAYKVGCGRGICQDFVYLLCYIGPSLVWNRKPFKPITNDQPACSLCHGDCVNGMCTYSDVCKPGGVTISGATVRPEFNGVYNLGFCADNSIIEGDHPQYIKDNYWYLYYDNWEGRWSLATLGDEENPKYIRAHHSTMDFPYYYSFCDDSPWKFLIDKSITEDSGIIVTSCGGPPEGTCSKLYGEEGTPCELPCDYRTDWKPDCSTSGQPNGDGGSTGSGLPSGDAPTAKGADPSGGTPSSNGSFSNSVNVYSIMSAILYLSCLF